jgi:hypothetical protein
MSFVTIDLNNKDPKAQLIIDYLNASNAALCIDQLKLVKSLVLNFGMKCGSSVTVLPEPMQNYFLEAERSTQVIAKAELQVEKVKNIIVNYFHLTGKKVDIAPNMRVIGNTQTLIGYTITLITSKSEKKDKKSL